MLTGIDTFLNLNVQKLKLQASALFDSHQETPIVIAPIDKPIYRMFCNRNVISVVFAPKISPSAGVGSVKMTNVAMQPNSRPTANVKEAMCLFFCFCAC